MKPVLRRRPAASTQAQAVPQTEPAPAPAAPKPLLRAKPKNVSRDEAKERLEQMFAKKQENVYQITIRRYKEKIKNPRTAIRAKCVECSGGMLKEVAECPVTSCALHPFRMGENPFNKKTRERLMRDGVLVPDESQDEDDEDGAVD